MLLLAYTIIIMVIGKFALPFQSSGSPLSLNGKIYHFVACKMIWL